MKSTFFKISRFFLFCRTFLVDCFGLLALGLVLGLALGLALALALGIRLALALGLRLALGLGLSLAQGLGLFFLWNFSGGCGWGSAS